MSQIQTIFEEWCNLRLQIGLIRKPKLTSRRKILIEESLCNHNVEDILLMIRYIRFSHDNYASFMRGDAGRKSDFTDCHYLFRKSKIQNKINRAKNWQSTTDSTTLDEVFIPFIIEDSKL